MRRERKRHLWVCVWHAWNYINNSPDRQSIAHSTQYKMPDSCIQFQTVTMEKIKSYMGGKPAVTLNVLSVCSVIHAVSWQQQYFHLLLQNAVRRKIIMQTLAILSEWLFRYAAYISKSTKINVTQQNHMQHVIASVHVHGIWMSGVEQ